MDAQGSVAPEVESDTLRADEPLREQVDIDSYDFLRFLLELEKGVGVAIPEKDYGKLVKLEDFIDYLAKRVQ